MRACLQGAVELEVVVGGVVLDCLVSPERATLLLQFEGQEAMSQAQLAREVGDGGGQEVMS